MLQYAKKINGGNICIIIDLPFFFFLEQQEKRFLIPFFSFFLSAPFLAGAFFPAAPTGLGVVTPAGFTTPSSGLGAGGGTGWAATVVGLAATVVGLAAVDAGLTPGLAEGLAADLDAGLADDFIPGLADALVPEVKVEDLPEVDDIRRSYCSFLRFDGRFSSF